MTCPTGNALQHQFGPRLLPMLENADDGQWQQLVDEATAERIRLEGELHSGRDRLLDKGVAGNVQFVQADAEALPFPDNHFDVVTIAFGLRNVTRKENALRSMLRVLKPGGRLLVLEFSKPGNPLLAKAYDTYSFSFMPLAGKLITNDADSYRYLAESIRKFPDQETLRGMMCEAGLEDCRYENLSGGIVALHRGFRY